MPPPFLPQAPICPSCLFSVTVARLTALRDAGRRGSAGASWMTQQRFYGNVRRTGRGERSSPSRMVLSDRVARDAGQEGKRRPRKWESPFGSMNQTQVPRGLPDRGRSGTRSDRSDSRPSFGTRGDSRNRGSADKRGGDSRRTKAMKMQSSLASISYGHRSRTKASITELKSFDQFDLLPAIKEAVSGEVLKGLDDIQPTPVQRVGIPALLGQDGRKRRRRATDGEESSDRTEYMLAAETGSGKTLAYLLPVVNALKQAEAADPAIAEYKEYFDKQMEAMQEPDYMGPRMFDPHPTAARPKVVVLVPTAELVDQVGAVAKALSHAVRFKAARFSANVSAKVINRDMYSPGGIDVVVATPHLLSSMADSDPNILSRVTHLVIDEADSLFDRSFSPVTTSILDRALPSLKQLVLCSATIPKRLENYVASQFPDMMRITTPNLHAIPRRVQLGVIDVAKDPYRNNKDLACADAIWSIGRDSARHESSTNPGEIDVKRIMVFVNEREKTQEVADYLVSKGIDAVALHRDTSEQRQSEMLDSFTSRDPLRVTSDKSPEEIAESSGKRAPGGGPSGGRRSLPNTKVIVATDLASRGIDTLAVRHVILYDVPHTTIDFIHRLGRAGRMGRRGRGIVLVGRTDKKDIVAEVRESMFMGQALV